MIRRSLSADLNLFQQHVRSLIGAFAEQCAGSEGEATKTFPPGCQFHLSGGFSFWRVVSAALLVTTKVGQSVDVVYYVPLSRWASVGQVSRFST